MKSITRTTTKTDAAPGAPAVTEETIVRISPAPDAPFLPECASEDMADDILSPGYIEDIKDDGVSIPVAVVPEGWSTTDLSRFFPPRAPTYRQGQVQMLDTDSLIAYANRHAAESSAIYAEQSETGGKVVLVLDDGAPRQPGRRVDRAVLEVHLDERFKQWLAIEGKSIPQRTFMEFVENHDREFASPNGAAMRTYVNGLNVKKTVRFKNVEVDSAANDVSLIYETETLEQGEIAFPQYITIKVPVLRHTAPVKIEARVRFDVEEGRVSFRVRLESLHPLLQAAWDNVINELRNALPDMAVLNGRAAT